MDTAFLSLSATFNHGCPQDLLVSKKTKLVVTIYQISSFILVTCYSSLLLSKLINSKTAKNIDTLEDIMSVPDLKVVAVQS